MIERIQIQLNRYEIGSLQDVILILEDSVTGLRSLSEKTEVSIAMTTFSEIASERDEYVNQLSSFVILDQSPVRLGSRNSRWKAALDYAEEKRWTRVMRSLQLGESSLLNAYCSANETNHRQLKEVISNQLLEIRAQQRLISYVGSFLIESRETGEDPLNVVTHS